jgi:hypothetical protein
MHCVTHKELLTCATVFLCLLGSNTNPKAAMARKRAKAKAKASALGPSQTEAVEGPAGVGAATAPTLPELPSNADVEGPAGVSAATAPYLPELPPIADVKVLWA